LTLLLDRLNPVLELTSTMSAGKLFRAFITRLQKNEERMLLLCDLAYPCRN